MSTKRCRDRADLVSVFLLMFILACEREPGILVNIAAWPDGVERIRVQTTIGDTTGTDFFINRDQTRFAVRVPVGSHGKVQIDAVGLDLMGCKLATGLLSEPVPDNLSRFVERTLALSPLPSHICPFETAMNLPIASGLYSVAVGDFNSDMKPDLVFATSTPTDGRVHVLHGDGMGSFYKGANIDVGKGQSIGWVAVGDFNGDMKQDVVVADYWHDAAVVLPGDGAGGFGPAKSFTVGSMGSRPLAVAVGDFNGDMKPDFAVANFAVNSISVLLGNGMGDFSMPANFAVGSNPTSVIVGNFNDDLSLDLAVANSRGDNISVLLGNGKGDFSIARPFTVGSRPTNVAVADFNGDKKSDLAAVSSGDAAFSVPPNVTVLLGNGEGGFGSASIPLNLMPSALAVGDFNGDMKPDLALACTDGSPTNNELRILLGDGVGGFGAASISPIGINPTSVAVGDFNGDRKPDLAVANFSSGSVSVLLNQF